MTLTDMPSPQTLPEIGTRLREVSLVFSGYCTALPDEQFFYQPPGKWSAAQQVKHLVTSANHTRLAYTLPKFILRLYTGKPNRSSRSYDELVARYQTKLEQGGKASGAFIPPPIPAGFGKKRMMDQFDKAMRRLARAIEKKWKERQLDQYLAPHPLLGRITLRELCYFTIHHTEHHRESINRLIRDRFSAATS